MTTLRIKKKWRNLETRRILGQFVNGFNYNYPLCCIFEFISRTNYPEIKLDPTMEELIRNQILFADEKDVDEDGSICIQCVDCGLIGSHKRYELG